MTKASNLSDSESAARRRILQFAQRARSRTEFNQFISDLKILMPVPDDLVLEATNEFNQQQSAENSDDNPSRKKKPRIENSGLQILEDGSPNLYNLFAGDLGVNIISYLSAAELCKVDILSKQLQILMKETWEKRTYERFGMKNGKDGWRMGTSLLREPVFMHFNRHPTYGDMYYAGGPHVTTNNSLVVVDTDDYNEDCAPDGIGLYSATDLSYLGPRQGGGWETIVAGPAENPLFVSYMSYILRFSRGDVNRQRQFPNNKNPHGMPLIATETHVIVVIANTIRVYTIVPSDNLVELCQTASLGREAQDNERDVREHYTSAISWGSDESEFVVYHSIRNIEDDDYQESNITVWKLHAETNTISRTQTIQVETKLRAVVLGDDFIAGACELKKIHVWDRHTEEKMQEYLCDVEEDDELNPFDIIWPLHMSCHGHMLVTTSHIGVALCIWNVRTGQLLKRYNHADEERKVDMLPDGCDATSMTYLKPLNSFICASGFLNAWAFPTNQQQKDTTMMIRNREEGYVSDWLASDD